MISRTINIIILVMIIPAILFMMASTGLFTYMCIVNDINKHALDCGIAIGTNGFMLLYYVVVLILNSISIHKINKARKVGKTNISRCCGITTIVMLIPAALYGIAWTVLLSDICIFCPSIITDLYIGYTIYHVILMGLSIWSIINIQKEKRNNLGQYEMLMTNTTAE